MPGGNAVSPPELARDAPVVDVGHPLHVGLLVHLRGELDVAFAHGGDGLVAIEAVSLRVLLTARNHCRERRGSMTAPVRCESAMASGVVLDVDEQAGGFEVGDDLLAGAKRSRPW